MVSFMATSSKYMSKELTVLLEPISSLLAWAAVEVVVDAKETEALPSSAASLASRAKFAPVLSNLSSIRYHVFKLRIEDEEPILAESQSSSDPSVAILILAELVSVEVATPKIVDIAEGLSTT